MDSGACDPTRLDSFGISLHLTVGAQRAMHLESWYLCMYEHGIAEAGMSKWRPGAFRHNVIHPVIIYRSWLNYICLEPTGDSTGRYIMSADYSGRIGSVIAPQSL